jgi:putative ABC transport system permease protein
MRLARRALAPWLLAVKRLRTDATLLAAVFAVIALSSFLFAVLPRVFNGTADDGLRFAVRQANPYERNVQIDQVGRILVGPQGRPLAGVEATGRRYEQRFAPSVRRVVGGRRDAVETVRFTAVDAPGIPGPPGTTRLLTMRFLSDAGQHLRVVDGRLPRGGAGDVQVPFRGEQRTASLVEIAVSTVEAGQLSIAVGDRLYLAPDTQDTLVRDVPLSEHRFIAVQITGLVAPRTPADEAWLHDSRLGRAATRDTDTRRFVYGYGLVAGSAYADVARASGLFPLRYEWRYDVKATDFDAGDLDAFQADVRRLDAEFGQTTYGQTVGVGVRSGLSAVLARFVRNRDAAEAVLAIAASALLAVALVVVALLTALAAERRSESVGLVRSRGGSIVQVLAAEAAEGLYVAAPAGMVGFLAALLVGGRGSALSAWLVLGLVLATALLLGLAALGPARRPPALRVREEAAVTQFSLRRGAIEGLAVVLCLLGVYLLRRRGVAQERGFDPYLVAVPLLSALAGALLAVRIYPLPMRALALGAGRRRDLVPALGFQRVARQPGVTAGPLLAILLAVSVAVFASTMAKTLAHAQSGLADLSPLSTGAACGFRLAVAVALAYACVAVVLAPVLTAAARLRDAAYLRALGLSRRQALGLTAVELGPPLGAAVLIGIVVGLAIVVAVQPGLDLAALAAGKPVGIQLDPLLPLVILLGLGIVLAVALAAVRAAERRTSLSRVLRMGER